MYIFNHTEVTSVQRIGQPQNRRYRADQMAFRRAQRAELRRIEPRRGLAMTARGLRDDLDLERIEAQQLGVLDQVVGVTVVAIVVDDAADVVQQRGVFEQFARLRAGLERRRGRVENLERQARDLRPMPVERIETPRQRTHRAPARLDRAASLRARVDHAQQDALAQRPGAGHQLRRARVLQHEVRQYRRRRHQVRTLGVGPRKLGALIGGELEQAVAQPGDVGGGDAQAVEPILLAVARHPRHRDQRVYGSRGANRAYHTGAARLAQQRIELAMQMVFEPAHLGRLGWVGGEEALAQPRDAQRQAFHP